MKAFDISAAIVVAIESSAVPRVDQSLLLARYGDVDGERLNEQVLDLLREAMATPIDWGEKSLADGVREILQSFGQTHPELNPATLQETGRCVGWNWR